MTKQKALAKYLEVKQSEVEEERADGYFSAEGKEYLVLTDSEAEQAAKDYILDSVWCFNSNFIIDHSKALDYDDASEQIIKAIAEQSESGNEAMKKLIDDLDEFVDDAISADGRGHFNSGYDGEEGEQDGFYIYRTN